MKEGKALSLKGEPSVSWLKWTLAQLVGSRLFSHEEGEPSVSYAGGDRDPLSCLDWQLGRRKDFLFPGHPLGKGRPRQPLELLGEGKGPWEWLGGVPAWP